MCARVPLAHGYPFRTEQAGAARLSNLASKVDSPTGTLDVPGVGIHTDPTTMTGCLVARAGDGFVTREVADTTALRITSFNLFASAPDLDAVIGLSAGRPASFSALATGSAWRPAASSTYATATCTGPTARSCTQSSAPTSST